MPTSEDSLSQFLAIDLNQVDMEHRRLRSLAVRNRFLAGLIDSLESHPGIDSIWMNLEARSSRHWVRGRESLIAHDDALSQPATEENREFKAFFASLAPTRKAIGSAARDSSDALHLTLPVWKKTQEYPRHEVLYAARNLLAHPDAVLTKDMLMELREKMWSERLPEAPGSRGPKQRL